jgi:hypothetical protein
VTAAGVVEQTDVGQDHRIDAKRRRAIDGALPVGRSSRLGEGIDRHQNLAVTRLGVADTFDHRLVVEIQAGEIACIGVVAVAKIDRIGAMVDRRLERRQTASGTDQVGDFSARHGGSRQAKPGSIVKPALPRLILVNSRVIAVEKETGKAPAGGAMLRPFAR